MSVRIVPDMDIRDAILESGGLDAFKCYQCGKCMAVCPWAHVDAVAYPVYRTPQAVRLGAIMASDDAAEIECEVNEVYRCVGCESCSTWCPHGVRLADILRAVRRILVEYGSYPSELSEAVSRIRSSGNPFGESREARGDWARVLGVDRFAAGMEYLLSPCCVPAYDPRARKVAEATVAVLRAADVSFGQLADAESCCCEAVRRVGAEDVFSELAAANVAAFAAAGVDNVVVMSPHCQVAFVGGYPERGADVRVVHQTELFADLLRQERLAPVRAIDRRVVYHDPCTLGRMRGVYDQPREVLASIPGLELVEIPHYSRQYSVCCGGGSGGVWLDRPKGERLSDLRVRQAADTGADVLAVACPYCLQMFSDSVTTMGIELEVKDVAELLAGAI